MVAFELIKCFAPAAAANLFFHSLFSLRMGRVIEREIAALAAPKGTVQWMKWIAVPAEAALFVELSWVVLAFGGLWAQQRSMAPPKKANQTKQTQQIMNNKRNQTAAQWIYLWKRWMKQAEHQGQPTGRGKPFSNSHFFFFVKKRNGIAEMEKGLKDIITVFLV